MCLFKEHEVVEHMRNFLKNFGKSTTAKEFIEEFVVLSVLGECSAKDFKTKSFFEFLYKVK